MSENERIQEAFGALHADERLKRYTKAYIRRNSFNFGQDLYRMKTRNRRIAACILSLVLVITGCGFWFIPSASIGVDINPSIELKVNALDRVIALEGRNSDGAALVENIDVTGMPYDDAMQKILLSRGMEPYLEQESMITITVAGGGTHTHAEEMLGKVLCRAYNIAQKDNVLYCQVDWETARAAQNANLCIPRYLAWQKLLESDPTVTAEDVRQIPKETIRILAQNIIIENPCGE